MSGATTTQRAWASIDLGALTHNWNVARETCPNQSFLPVIKSNGYGHGIESIAGQLMKDTRGLEGVAVAAMSEAQRLRDCGVTKPIILLPGFINQVELSDCMRLDIEPVVHSKFQVDMLLDPQSGVGYTSFKRFWLKANTGMNRLGMSSKQWQDCYEALRSSFPKTEVVAMSHLACADDVTSSCTPSQVQQFDAVTSTAMAAAAAVSEAAGEDSPTPLRRSLSASGGILAWPSAHCDIVRPGIMLYGSSPFAARSAEQCGLRPVMTLHSRVIAINHVQPGDSVGYGDAFFVADKPMRIGVVSIGYGDGYPRRAPSGTPLLVASSSSPSSSPSEAGTRRMLRMQLAGRVSMDMITIDLTGTEGEVEVGAEVVLWGQGLPAEDIAALCGTISYELFCQVTPRVVRITL